MLPGPLDIAYEEIGQRILGSVQLAWTVEDALNVLTRHGIASGRLNIEELLTQIDLRLLGRMLGGREEQELSNARAVLEEVVRDRCSPDAIQPSDAAIAFCGVLGADDAIVTFNYDILMEQALWRMERWTPALGYGLEAKPEIGDDALHSDFCRTSPTNGLVTVFKPHGSWNWYYGGPYTASDGTQYSHELAVLVEGLHFVSQSLPAGERFAMPFVAEHVRQSHEVLRTSILPSFIKTYSRHHTVLRLIWHKAYAAIARAREIWVIGYSIPQADTDAQLLLSAASPDARWHVVDTQPDTVAERLRDLVSPNDQVETHERAFERFDWSVLRSVRR
jgi:hypothetical protein